MLKLNIQRFGGRGASSTPTQRKGMGMANRAGIPVYNGAIDYTGDFNGANLKSMTNKQLNTAIKVQTEQYNKYNNARNSFDGRTRNGRMERTFNSARASQYKAGLDNLNAEKTRRKNNSFNPKEFSLDEAIRDTYGFASPELPSLQSKANRVVRGK